MNPVIKNVWFEYLAIFNDKAFLKALGYIENKNV